jgi:hypothetical protein
MFLTVRFLSQARGLPLDEVLLPDAGFATVRGKLDICHFVYS